jgi:hypothetical protein
MADSALRLSNIHNEDPRNEKIEFPLELTLLVLDGKNVFINEKRQFGWTRVEL